MGGLTPLLAAELHVARVRENGDTIVGFKIIYPVRNLIGNLDGQIFSLIRRRDWHARKNRPQRGCGIGGDRGFIKWPRQKTQFQRTGS
jgi:hypothetical protein